MPITKQLPQSTGNALLGRTAGLWAPYPVWGSATGDAI